jgi:hypothetical protein
MASLFRPLGSVYGAFAQQWTVQLVLETCFNKPLSSNGLYRHSMLKCSTYYDISLWDSPYKRADQSNGMSCERGKGKRFYETQFCNLSVLHL